MPALFLWLTLLGTLLIRHTTSTDLDDLDVRDAAAATSSAAESVSTSISTVSYVGVTYLPGSISVLNTVGSICGFVTSNIHWPVYCGVSEYCNTGSQYLECCTSMSSWSVTVTNLETLTSTMRNAEATTYTSTYLNSNEYAYNLYGCMSMTCYNSTAASSCTGTCTKTALACTDPNWPYCASVYMNTWHSDSAMSTGSYVGVGTSFLCDTAAYGLTYDNLGYWPSVASTYTTTLNYNSTTTKPTWTPTVVPYSNTQASRPASAPSIAGPTATTSSGASSRSQCMTWACLLAAAGVYCVSLCPL